MFNLKIKFMLAAAVLFIGGVSAANAQLASGAAIKADIPNSFVLRGETFPAGKYTIARTPSTIDSPSLMILRGDKTAAIFDTMQEESRTVAKDTVLIFDSVNGVDYLSKIVLSGDRVTMEIPKSRAEQTAFAKASKVQHVIVSEVNGF